MVASSRGSKQASARARAGVGGGGGVQIRRARREINVRGTPSWHPSEGADGVRPGTLSRRTRHPRDMIRARMHGTEWDRRAQREGGGKPRGKAAASTREANELKKQRNSNSRVVD